jgi:2-oxoacid:acceptor oxidoreductase delta subunit (pyruvate/2-ketoisovalerate family)
MIELKKKKQVGIEKIEYLGKKGIPYMEATGDSVKRNVGSWRIFRPIIDKNKCIRCRQCWISCPESAMKLDDKDFPRIDYRVCKGCLVCADVCPVKCIKKVRETHDQNNNLR